MIQKVKTVLNFNKKNILFFKNAVQTVFLNDLLQEQLDQAFEQ